jgi:hypothetical protein
MITCLTVKKMMNLNKTLYFILLLSLCFFACDKHDHDDHSHGVVTVTKIAPADNQVFAETDTIWLRINLKSSEGDVHNYKIEVKNTRTNAIVYNYQGHSHKNELTTALWFIQSVDSTSLMELNIATYDHDGKIGSQTKSNFTIQNTTNATDASVSLVSPTINADLKNGSSNPLKINVSHPLGLKNIAYTIKNETNKQILQEKIYSNIPNLKSFAIDSLFNINVTDHTDISINLNATDSTNHVTVRSWSFHINP